MISTAFGELEQGPPDPTALEPRRGPGAGVTRSPTSDLFGVLGRGDGSTLPGGARRAGARAAGAPLPGARPVRHDARAS